MKNDIVESRFKKDFGSDQKLSKSRFFLISNKHEKIPNHLYKLPHSIKVYYYVHDSNWFKAKQFFFKKYKLNCGILCQKMKKEMTPPPPPKKKKKKKLL